MVEMPRPADFAEATEIVDNVAKPRHRSAIKRAALVAALLAGTAAIGAFGHHYMTVGRYLQSTDDAYVKADYTTAAPKISGYIAEVLVNDNEQVTAGQVLARIDDRDFRTALAQAQADVSAASASVDNLIAQINLQQSMIAQAKAALDASRATQDFANADAQRYRDLVQTGSGTLQRAQQTQSISDQATAQSQRDEAGLAAAQKQVDVLSTQLAQARAQLARAKANAQQAELNLSYTTITAPVNGTIGARSLRVGQFVNAGTELMAIVPLNATYVVANFKETQLARVRAGQPVEIKVDSFPGLRLTGHVDSLSPASGLEFALLPPDNATGNFTKIVQRIPVKITLDGPAMNGMLRAGMSVEPTINTRMVTSIAAPAAPGAPMGTPHAAASRSAEASSSPAG